MYAKTVCVEVGPDGEVLSTSLVPVKIVLGAAASIRMPREGDDYSADLDDIFPDLGVDVAVAWPEAEEMEAEARATRT
ncbi:hypothetical protein [Catellatospora tritici]|uniref:hypothetical protein n=1 Tax=Catellatospora tritici TaxID=2851566 RepID=UPI001C2D2720|nr:hypothetical protein [Catellatospora tritici]MBV1855984.1 hypothetical protein [Catellatospora tritici]